MDNYVSRLTKANRAALAELFRGPTAFWHTQGVVLGARVTPKTFVNLGICPRVAWTLGLLVAVTPGSALAAGSRVENRCSRLSAAEYEELDARVQLLLQSERTGHSVPSVVCSEQESWVEWNGERFAINGRGPIVDEVVDILERQLHDAARKSDTDPKTTEDRAAVEGDSAPQADSTEAPRPPAEGRPADRRAVRAADARGGGVAISLETQLPAPVVGPAIDFGASVGPLILGGREAFRSSTSGRQVVFMDFEGSVAYGAPLNPDALFGAVVRFGAEWMVAYPQGNSGQADVAPELAVGLRVARSFGMVGFWFGADARFRLRKLHMHVQEDLANEDVVGSLSLGAAFVDWSRK